jgi:hypothetical protein
MTTKPVLKIARYALDTPIGERRRGGGATQVPQPPQEILVRPDGAEGYVSRDGSRRVAVLDLKHWKVEKLIGAGRNVDGLARAPQSAGQ